MGVLKLLTVSVVGAVIVVACMGASQREQERIESRRIAEELQKREREDQAKRLATAEAAKTPEQRAAEAASAAAAAKDEERRNAAIAKALPAIEKLKWWEACTAWGKERRLPKRTDRLAAFEQRLEREKLLVSADYAGATSKRVAVGMSTCGVFAAWGVPEDINTTTTARRSSHQMVYRSSSAYVYVEGEPESGWGLVTTVQN